MYRSSRGTELISSSEAILKGLADDGGLYIPSSIDKIGFDQSWLDLDYKDIARRILKHFFADFTIDEIDEVVEKSYSTKNFPNHIIKLKSFDTHSYLELFHGPTLAFKDMALTMLPHLMEVANRKINYTEKLVILTATSGDTGGAALSGFSSAENIETVVLYPNGGISNFQEKQMLSFTNEKAKAFSVDANFDECQRIVKDIFLEYDNKDIVLSSANSINIGRLVPQVIYYFAGYIEMVKRGDISFGDEINVCVPTGNFGNILASYFAMLIGLPIRDFICASNQNNVLTDFFNTGIYDINRVFQKTNSPSMDILISSNLERLIALLSQNHEFVCSLMEELKVNKKYQLGKDLFEKMKCFKGYFASEDETLKTIKNVFEKDNYLIDPHTAVAKCCFDKYEDNGCRTLIISTASPLKFSEDVCESLGLEKANSIEKIIEYTDKSSNQNIDRILNSKTNRIVMRKEDILDYIFKGGFNISVPATSANLACAFDVAGISIDIFNKYYFYLSDTFKCINFIKPFDDYKNNLIIRSYQYVFEKLGKKIRPISVIEIDNQIPISRGLGSSASLIVAGVLAACHVLKIEDEDFIINTLVELEGHPDNVLPAYFGGFIASYKTDKGYKYVNYPISAKLKFMIAYPDFKVSTEDARGVLPQTIDYSSIVYDLSRVIHLTNALGNGNLDLLIDILDDKLHQPYRIPLIYEAKEILSIAKKHGYASCVSGSGSTLLFIGHDYELLDIIRDLSLNNKWHLSRCEINLLKTKVNERC